MEIVTGLVSMADPAIVGSLLLGVDVSGAAALLARCFGIAVLALGLACWPARKSSESRSAAVRAMLAYNVLIALYLAYLGTVGHVRASMLWPAVALHAAVALLLVWARRAEQRSGTGA